MTKVPTLRPCSRRRGALLIEFLLVGFVLTSLIFMGIQFGLLMSELQLTGEGARVAARDAATKPGPLVLPATSNSIYEDPGVFNENFTVIDAGAVNLDDQFRALPAVHSLLRANMVLDTTSFPGRSLLRFMGVLLQSDTDPSKLIVRIPDITGGNAILRRVIDPPASMNSDGTVRMECNQWFEFTSWFLGGVETPGTLTYANIPTGYSVVSIDLRAGSRHGMRLGSFAVARKEIQ